MSIVVGTPVLFQGERWLVKRVNDNGSLSITDDDGFTINVPPLMVREFAADYRCYLCKRVLGAHDADWVNVDFGLHIERVCDTCWERGQEAILAPLDYTEDEG